MFQVKDEFKHLSGAMMKVLWGEKCALSEV
jgi:hypothetical protein